MLLTEVSLAFAKKVFRGTGRRVAIADIEAFLKAWHEARVKSNYLQPTIHGRLQRLLHGSVGSSGQQTTEQIRLKLDGGFPASMLVFLIS